MVISMGSEVGKPGVQSCLCSLAPCITLGKTSLSLNILIYEMQIIKVNVFVERLHGLSELTWWLGVLEQEICGRASGTLLVVGPWEKVSHICRRYMQDPFYRVAVCWEGQMRSLCDEKRVVNAQ